MPDLADGETAEMKGSAAKPYVIKNTGGVYSCSCPAWRNQSAAIESRTCKHIRRLRGDDAEEQRIGNALPAKRKSTSKKNSPPLLLAQPWDNATDLKDWWISEKLDGVRAYWNGTHFLSRQGNQYHAPDWFTDGFPSTPLDGELWIDRGAFQRTVSVVRRQDKSDQWNEVRYVVFDAPAEDGEFEERIAMLADQFGSNPLEYVSLLEQERCKSISHLKKKLAKIESLGGEGLMLRKPESKYEVGRSSTLLKVKSFFDAEALVIDHTAGRGKHKGRLGALVVQLDDGTEFSVGTGFTDRQRENPPAVGSTITFRYQEFSDAGVPRFPSFLRLATEDKSKPEKASVTPAEIGSKTVKKANKKKATKKVPKKASKQDDTDLSLGGDYFEFDDGKSQKFWEIKQDGLEVTVRYGRIGTSGQTKTKSFDTQAKANKHVEKLTEQKKAKGYEEANAR